MTHTRIALLAFLAWAGLPAAAVAQPAAAGTATAESPFADQSPDPDLPHSPGLYMLGAIGGEDRMTKVRPVALELAGNRLTIPLFNARVQTTDRKPIFYAYFDRSLPPELKQAAMGDWEGERENGGPTPGVILVRLSEGANWRSGEKPIPAAAQIPYDSMKVRIGVFRIQPKVELAPGEYGFVQLLPAKGQARRVRVFDFGVEEVKSAPTGR